ncbi:MAG: hypothetical protein FJZ90_13435 [Chloroflexi bacterium]|nr:hypothetical protein [Chloroflexota bacterium]
MKAGFAEAVITPPDGKCFLAGYAGPWATGVHDDVYASAVYLDDGETRALLVSFDLIALEAPHISRLKRVVRGALDVPEDHIFFTCTHTHEGPEVRKRKHYMRDGQEIALDYQEAYYGFLDEQVKGAAVRAAESAVESDMLVNRAHVDENHNRRLFLNNGQFLGTPGHKELICAAGEYADKELGLVYFCPRGSRHPLGVIANYTMHPLTAGNTSTLISADVPGVVRNVVRESMQCLTCYITGATGDNHPKRAESGFAEMERVGRELGTEVVNRRYNALKVGEPIRLRCLTRSLTLRLRTVEELRAIPHRGEGDAWMEPILREIETPGAPVEVQFTLLGMGPVLFIGVPGEMVSELGQTLKWFSPFKRTYIMYEATEHFSYIAHPNAYVWGGGEAIDGHLSPSAVRPLINAILDAAEEISP